VSAGSKIEFGLEDAEGFMFGYSELKVPSTAFEKNETEVLYGSSYNNKLVE